MTDADADADAVTPGVTHVGSYNRPPDGNILFPTLAQTGALWLCKQGPPTEPQIPSAPHPACGCSHTG